MKFNVVTTKAGAGVLKVNIEGPSKVAITCRDTDDGYEFSYTPKAAGDYLIHIKFGNVNIAGCPFKAVVAGKNCHFYTRERIFSMLSFISLTLLVG